MAVLVPGETEMEFQSPLLRRVAELEMRVGALEAEVGHRVSRAREKSRERVRKYRAKKKAEGK